MEKELNQIPALTLRTAPDGADGFTTLLQTGVHIATDRGISIGGFLKGLPGFTAEYITDQVQTIFLNGTATDDMETPLDGVNPTLAVSAAMPGLAGAIFRRNSLHAALRTVKLTERSSAAGGSVTVNLKLFNAIARDRGSELLRRGVTVKAVNLARFLDSRGTVAEQIIDIDLQGKRIAKDDLEQALSGLDTIHLTLVD